MLTNQKLCMRGGLYPKQ